MQAFKVWPKRIKKSNGQILSPEMVVLVTMRCQSPSPFANGATELKAMYKSLYHCDLNKMGYSPSDFNYISLA